MENSRRFFNPIELTMPTPLSGYALDAMGWEKKGFEWWKGLSKITYDGCNWMYFDFPDCVKDENYSTEGLKIVPIKIQNVEEIKR